MSSFMSVPNVTLPPEIESSDDFDEDDFEDIDENSTSPTVVLHMMKAPTR